MAGPDRRQLVIVALPSETDYVRKISSEKEPHLTLLYLGNPDYDSDQFALIHEYVGHASALTHRFTLEVDRRGELGEKNADVLFFYKDYTARAVKIFREHLLQNPLVSAAYNAEEQFEGWTPHLTLGYPDNPAKKPPNDYDAGVTYVNFDRIALWLEDSEGPTYPLKTYSYDDMEVAMSQLQTSRPDVVANMLQHHGVKGMKWGVRRSDSGSGGPSRKVAKADAKFEKKAQSSKTTFAIYNAAASHVNKHDIDRINNKAKYRDADLTKPSKLRDQYYKEHEDAMISALKTAAKDLGTNASGTKQYGISVDKDGGWDVRVEDVKHDAASTIKIIPVFDDRGFIVSFSVSEGSLKHYGVKGMKWGVRRSQSDLDSSSGRSASEDSVHVNTLRDKAARGGASALSNAELKKINERMNLEQQYAGLVGREPTAIDRGHDQVKKTLSLAKTATDVYNVVNSPAGKAARKLLFGV